MSFNQFHWMKELKGGRKCSMAGRTTGRFAQTKQPALWHLPVQLYFYNLQFTIHFVNFTTISITVFQCFQRFAWLFDKSQSEMGWLKKARLENLYCYYHLKCLCFGPPLLPTPPHPSTVGLLEVPFLNPSILNIHEN